MRLRKLLRGATPASGAEPRRRRRTPRADGPRTIVPLDGTSPAGAGTPFTRNVDAARERLRRAVPPVDDEQ